MKEHYPYVCEFCGVQGSLNEEIRQTHTDEECLGNLERHIDMVKRSIKNHIDDLVNTGEKRRRVQERQESEVEARQQDFADAGHPSTEEAMAEAEAHHDLATNR